jgi:hypothetical protein
MNSLPRLALGAGTCLLCGFLLFQAESNKREISPTATPETGDSLDFEVNRRADLDERLACVQHIIALQEEIASDLIVGRLTVAEAATEFQDLEKVTPGANHEFFQRAYPGLTDAERYCRQAIERAVQVDASAPKKHEALRSRLEAEFQTQFKNNKA